MNKQRYIISLGGSLIIPDEIDISFIKNLRTVLVREARRGKSFMLAPGGGRTARKYAAAARLLGDQRSADLDWLGIYAIRLNRLLMTFAFHGHKRIQILDAVRAKPGESSDCHAVDYARTHRAHAIINLSDVDYVYDKNPKSHKDAKPLKKISWPAFRQIVGTAWAPSQSWPFDPIASRKAQQLKLQVIFLNGRNLKNLQNFLAGKKFIGTVIG